MVGCMSLQIVAPKTITKHLFLFYLTISMSKSLKVKFIYSEKANKSNKICKFESTQQRQRKFTNVQLQYLQKLKSDWLRRIQICSDLGSRLANMMAFWVGHEVKYQAKAWVKRSHVSILAGMLLLGNEIPFAEIG